MVLKAFPRNIFKFLVFQSTGIADDGPQKERRPRNRRLFFGIVDRRNGHKLYLEMIRTGYSETLLSLRDLWRKKWNPLFFNLDLLCNCEGRITCTVQSANWLLSFVAGPSCCPETETQASLLLICCRYCGY